MNIWTIVFVVGLIFVIGVVVFLVAENTFFLDLPPGPSCYITAECGQVNVCEDGHCRAPIGAPCSNIGDCVREAMACTNGVCIAGLLGGAGDACPCQEAFRCTQGVCRGLPGAPCEAGDDCASNLCMDGVCVEALLDIRPIPREEEEPYIPSPDPYPEEEPYIPPSPVYSYNPPTPEETYSSYCYSSYDCPEGYICSPRCVYQGYPNGKILPLLSKKHQHGENAVDLTVHYEDLYILLEGGDILKIYDKMAIRIASDLSPEAIFSFNGHLCGLSSGCIYRYNETKGKWHLIEYLPGDITDVGTTINSSHLWIRSKGEDYLCDEGWHLDKCKERVKGRRYYGLYPDIWKAGAGIKTGAYFPDGFFLSYDQESDVYLVKVVYYQGEYVPMFIYERKCNPE